jgi:hypothetical protein
MFWLFWKAIIRQLKKYAKKDNLNTPIGMILIQIAEISTLQKLHLYCTHMLKLGKNGDDILKCICIILKIIVYYIRSEREV